MFTVLELVIKHQKNVWKFLQKYIDPPKSLGSQVPILFPLLVVSVITSRTSGACICIAKNKNREIWRWKNFAVSSEGSSSHRRTSRPAERAGGRRALSPGPPKHRRRLDLVANQRLWAWFAQRISTTVSLRVALFHINPCIFSTV
jgi:hypothetical protein